MILSGYVPTPVPGPTEVPTRVPGPVVVPTPVPGPTIVTTPMPFWLRQITGILRAEGEIQVQVLGVTLDSSESMTVRGQGLLSAVLSSMDLAPADQFLRGQAAIWVAGDREVEYPVHLEGRGEILASGVAMVMSAGVRALAGRGAVTAGGISTALQALVNLRGQGRVTASPTAMALTDPVARILAGRGAIQVSAGYPAMPRQAIAGGAGYANYQTGWVKLAGWAPDPTYPAVIDGDGLQITGSGPAIVTISSSSSGNIDWQLRRNGTSVHAWTAWNPAGITWAGTLTAGDVLTLWISTLAGSASNATIDVTPT